MMLRRRKIDPGMEALHLLQCKKAFRDLTARCLTGFPLSGMKRGMKRAIIISIIICG
jgi:hypothetical protein